MCILVLPSPAIRFHCSSLTSSIVRFLPRLTVKLTIMRRRALWTVSLLVRASSTLSCYWPDGTLADHSWTPCNATAQVSHCCYDTDVCLDNGYCFVQKGAPGYTNRIVRGACTDQFWSTPNCPDYCTTGTFCDFILSSSDGEIMTY